MVLVTTAVPPTFCGDGAGARAMGAGARAMGGGGEMLAVAPAQGKAIHRNVYCISTTLLLRTS